MGVRVLLTDVTPKWSEKSNLPGKLIDLNLKTSRHITSFQQETGRNPSVLLSRLAVPRHAHGLYDVCTFITLNEHFDVMMPYDVNEYLHYNTEPNLT